MTGDPRPAPCPAALTTRRQPCVHAPDQRIPRVTRDRLPAGHGGQGAPGDTPAARREHLACPQSGSR